MRLKDFVAGLFINCIRKSEYDAVKLMKILFKFESYRDEIMFHGKPSNYCYIIPNSIGTSCQLNRTFIGRFENVL